MDICLRSGSYDDALDLRAFVAKIAVLQPDLQVGSPDLFPVILEQSISGADSKHLPQLWAGYLSFQVTIRGTHLAILHQDEGS